MYSVYGNTVLDPFCGTGTTSLAAMVAARNSVGVERDPDLVAAFEERAGEVPALSETVVRERLDDHRAFVRESHEAGDSLDYEAEHYDVPVRTKQERGVRLYTVEDVAATAEGYGARHRSVETVPDGPE